MYFLNVLILRNQKKKQQIIIINKIKLKGNWNVHFDIYSPETQGMYLRE